MISSTQPSLARDHLREVSGRRGYVNTVANPVVTTDESRGTIDLVLEVDEGQAYDFGKLYLEGVEPHPGAGKALEFMETVGGQAVQPGGVAALASGKSLRLEGKCARFRLNKDN